MAPTPPLEFMGLALAEARKSPPKPSNYCVGAVLVDESDSTILATGYTMEIPGNTHAEQCCLQKFATLHNVPEGQVGSVLPPAAVLYTTMEPCIKRLSGNLPCVQRILKTKDEEWKGIMKVYVGITEPDHFVLENSSSVMLKQHDIEYIHVPGLEEEILAVATAGHEKRNT